jgi:hypothetical protein
MRVSCRADAGKLVDEIPYGLSVTLEVEERAGIPIYDEVRTRIRPAVAIPTR